jgi:hypothetical protein
VNYLSFLPAVLSFASTKRKNQRKVTATHPRLPITDFAAEISELITLTRDSDS